MGDKSRIEWTEATWNPVRGCTKVSEGCRNCYAERFAERFRGTPGPYEQGFDLRLVPEKIDQPARWKRPRRIFVNSMSDLFHEGVDDAYIERVCRVMADADHHAYQVLTKRHTRLQALLSGDLRWAAELPHVWWGVSAEDVPTGQPRIDALCDTPASRRWVSVEPLIADPAGLRLAMVDWVVVGGESGPGARPMEPDWVRGLLRTCQRLGIPFFLKQWGGAKAGGEALLDGEEYRDYPLGM